VIALTHIWLFELFGKPLPAPPAWKQDIILHNASRLRPGDVLRVVSDVPDYFNELLEGAACAGTIDVQRAASPLAAVRHEAGDPTGGWLRRHIRHVCQLTDLLRLACCLRDPATLYLDTDCRLLDRAALDGLGPPGRAWCMAAGRRPYLSAIAVHGARRWAHALLQHQLADLEDCAWPWVCLALPGDLGHVGLLPADAIHHHYGRNVRPHEEA